MVQNVICPHLLCFGPGQFLPEMQLNPLYCVSHSANYGQKYNLCGHARNMRRPISTKNASSPPCGSFRPDQWCRIQYNRVGCTLTSVRFCHNSKSPPGIMWGRRQNSARNTIHVDTHHTRVGQIRSTRPPTCGELFTLQMFHIVSMTDSCVIRTLRTSARNPTPQRAM